MFISWHDLPTTKTTAKRQNFKNNFHVDFGSSELKFDAPRESIDVISKF